MSETRKRSQAHFDWPLLAAVVALSLFGVYCITIATYDPDTGTDLSLLNNIINSRSSTMQSVWLLISPIVIAVVLAVPMEIYRARVRLIYYAVLALLVFTFISAELVNGIKAWLDTGLGRSIQPCEFAKISIILMLAHQLSRTQKPMGTFKEFINTCILVGVPAVVVLAQSETGTVIVIGFVFLIMMYFAGVDYRIVFGMVFVIALGAAAIIGYAIITDSDDYRILRLLAFTDPEKYAQDGGYQLLNSQMTIGSGQMTGIGTFMIGSLTQLQYVPENSTDFIFTVVGESFGFVGCMFVLGVYMFIIFRMLYLARFTEDGFGRLIIIGVMAMLFFHVFQNIAMTLGLMPITGIPLPFLSYGGSSYVTNIAGIALVLNVTRSRSAAQVKTTIPRYAGGNIA